MYISTSTGYDDLRPPNAKTQTRRCPQHSRSSWNSISEGREAHAQGALWSRRLKHSFLTVWTCLRVVFVKYKHQRGCHVVLAGNGKPSQCRIFLGRGRTQTKVAVREDFVKITLCSSAYQFVQCTHRKHVRNDVHHAND